MKRPKVTGLRRRESWQALPFLLPSLLGLCLFYLFPLAETVRASFMDPLRSRAVGWGNYRALFQNTAFRLAVRNTCRFLCICIPALLAVYNDMRFQHAALVNMYIEALPEGKRPSACIGCGACAAICPQSIDIPAALADLAAHVSSTKSWAEISRERAEEAERA